MSLKLFFLCWSAVKMRNHVILNDTSLNGRRVVYINAFQNFLFTAMKMHGYLKSWGASPRIEFILGEILLPHVEVHAHIMIDCGFRYDRTVHHALLRQHTAQDLREAGQGAQGDFYGAAIVLRMVRVDRAHLPRR